VPGWLRAVLVRGLRRDPKARFPSMDALLAAITHGRRRRVRVWTAVGGAALLAAGGTAWALAPSGGPTPCQGLDHHVASVWNEPRRLGVRAAFAASKRPYGPELASRVIAELDRKAASWTRMRVDVCEATRVRGDQSEALLDARNRCLDRQLSELAAVTTVFASPPSPKIIDEALATAQRLAPVDECANVDRLAQVVAPSAEPVTLARISLAERERARARAQATSGDYRSALPIARTALALAESTGYAPLLAAALRDVGDLERKAGNHAEAERHFDRALEVAVEARDAMLEAEVLVSLLELRARDQKRPKEAIALARPIEATLARAGKPPGLRIAALTALAMAYRYETDYEQQRRVLEQALALAEASFGPDHLVTVGVVCQLAPALDDLREREAALPVAERCVAMRERALGPRHPDVARARHALGIVYNGLLRRADAEAAYTQAITIYEAALGPDDPYLANVYADRATSQRRQNKLAEALASAERALAIDRKSYGDAGHVNVGHSQTSVGHLLRDLGRYDEALAMYRSAVELFTRLHDAEHPYVGTTYGSMGETYEKMKRYDEAIEMQERTLAIQSKRPEFCAQPYMARVTLSEPLLLRARAGDRARVVGLLRVARDGLRACGPKADREMKKLEGLVADYKITL
jgi:tetratricopeptide (TPR) repeat protein